MRQKKKIDKLDSTKIKRNFCVLEDTMKEWKGNVRNERNICKSYI